MHSRRTVIRCQSPADDGLFRWVIRVRPSNCTDAGESTIEYVTGYGQPIQRGSVTAIPEPGTVVILISGLAGLAVLGWRRRRAA